MAKKKAKKKVAKRKPVKKRVVRKKAVKKAKTPAIKRKAKRTSRQSISGYNFRLALRDLILFAVLALICFILYSVSGTEFYQDMFALLAMILGFIALAFLIVFLVLVFARGKVKKK